MKMPFRLFSGLYAIWLRGALCIAASILLMSTSARAEHFAIDLTVQAPHDIATAHSDTDPPAQGNKPRPLCHAKSTEELTFQFFLTSNFPHGTKKAVTIRYYIVPEKEAGKKDPPQASRPAVTEGSFTMDFKPDGRVGLRQRLHIDKAGAYLVRVQSEHSDSDHEHFAALDLVIK
jgi:hypothetical protein